MKINNPTFLNAVAHDAPLHVIYFLPSMLIPKASYGTNCQSAFKYSI